MRWQIRWARNALCGALPFRQSLRRLKRRLVGYPDDFPDFTLEEGLRLLSLLRESGCDIRGAAVLEIGAGWRPILPVLFSLAGAERIVLSDTERLMDAGTFQATVRHLADRATAISDRLALDDASVRGALETCSRSLDELLARFRMQYLAPCDVASHVIDDGQFDVIISRAVLEHVPPPALRPLLARSFGLLKPGGWACHAIDNSDHFSHWDRRLSRVNFLRYSERMFGLLTAFNPLDYQNRLRHPEYDELLRQAGFEVVLAHSEAEPQVIAELDTIPLAPRFARFAREDLARLDSYFIARRP